MISIPTFRTWAISFLLLIGLKPAFSGAIRMLPSAQDADFTLEGKITQHSAGRLTVGTEENIVFHIRYDEKAVIKRQDGSAGSAKDFRVGLKIRVEGELTESGEIIAQKIELQQDPPSRQR